MATRIELIRQLREETGAGVSACRMALEEAGGNIQQALSDLREQVAAEAARRANRQASQGRIELYSHPNGRIGVMVEINTETDFSGRSEILCSFAHEVALQIAAAAPSYVRDEDIPAEVLVEETRKAVELARREGKPETLVPRIVEGLIKKYMDEQVLLRQAYIRDGQLTIAKLLNQAVASLGENIVIRRFTRWELAEDEKI
jgi:elongation factor Ts